MKLSLADCEFTIILPYDAACALIAGEVPQDVRIACISGIRALIETPAESVTKPKRRRTAQTEAA